MNNYNIPDYCTHIKLDIGLSYSAPQSQIWLSKEPNLMVFGFEPNPECVESIQKGNIQKRNHSHGTPLDNKYINDKRFHLFPVALNNVENKEKMLFYMGKNDPGTSSLFKPKEGVGHTYKSIVNVDVISLKMFFETFPWNRFDYIDYIKIDAQGSDLNIIKSCGEYLSEKVVFITAEPDGKQYENADECNAKNIIDYMNSQNFERIIHKNTRDPTFINKKFMHLKDKIFISQV